MYLNSTTISWYLNGHTFGARERCSGMYIPQARAGGRAARRTRWWRWTWRRAWRPGSTSCGGPGCRGSCRPASPARSAAPPRPAPPGTPAATTTLFVFGGQMFIVCCRYYVVIIISHLFFTYICKYTQCMYLFCYCRVGWGSLFWVFWRHLLNMCSADKTLMSDNDVVKLGYYNVYNIYIIE